MLIFTYRELEFVSLTENFDVVGPSPPYTPHVDAHNIHKTEHILHILLVDPSPPYTPHVDAHNIYKTEHILHKLLVDPLPSIYTICRCSQYTQN